MHALSVGVKLSAMGAEADVFGAFYRRFEDEVLGYFMARGAAPEVAADLTAETFAAVLPSTRWKRLATEARKTLDASCREGRVVARARRRRHMPPLALTDDSVASIAALDVTPFALATELHVDEHDDVRVRIVDETDAAHLRLSGAVISARGVEPSSGDPARIPGLEAALVAAIPPGARRPRGALLAAVGLAVAGLAVLLIAAENSDRRQLSPAQASAEFRRDSEREVARTGNLWAMAFAASGHQSCVLDMTHAACQRVTCRNGAEPVKNCEPLPAAVKSSFRGATVEDVVVQGRRALARFSNGQVVEFVDGGPHAPWQVHVVGVEHGAGLRLERERSPDVVARVGNEWARLFAASDQSRCNQYMTQPACEHVTTIRFRHSFHGATVEDVVIKGTRAAAKFTNGELVELRYVGDPGGEWWVEKLGGDAGRQIYEEAQIERAGNAWARFFAASTRHCVEHMTQRACEQVVSAPFKRSFRDATVEDVPVIKGRSALAKFSNGELVEFRYVADEGGRWWVARLGGGARLGRPPE